MFNPTHFDFSSNKDLDTFLVARDKIVRSVVIGALKKNGATKAQRRQANSLLGFSLPTDEPICSNLSLIRYTTHRLTSGLSQLFDPSVDAQLRYVVFDDGTPVQDHAQTSIDFRDQRDTFAKFLKSEANSYIAMPIARCEKAGVGVRVAALLWNEDRRGVPRAKRRPRLQRATFEKHCDVKLDSSGRSVAAAIASMLNPLKIDGIDARQKKGDWKFKIDEEGEQLLLRAFVLQASMRLHRMAFAHGSGRVVLNSVNREVRARAASLDFGSQALVSEPAINRTLAEFPGPDGTRQPLPAIRHL